MARLDERLARNLGLSRTKVRSLLDEGRVSDPAGTPLGDPRTPVPDGPYPVLVDGDPVTLVAEAYFLLNKPAGYITALRDERHEVAYSLLRGAPLFPELRPVGRLDLDTTGLLLWTSDGAWLQRLTHPKRAVPRTYHAALARPFQPPPPDLVLDDGHRPNITALRPLAPAEAHPALARPADAPVLAEITIVGGAYHEVRRIFAALGSHVGALARVRFGRLALPTDLAAGAYVPVAPGEV